MAPMPDRDWVAILVGVGDCPDGEHLVIATGRRRHYLLQCVARKEPDKTGSLGCLQLVGDSSARSQRTGHARAV